MAKRTLFGHNINYNITGKIELLTEINQIYTLFFLINLISFRCNTTANLNKAVVYLSTITGGDV